MEAAVDCRAVLAGHFTRLLFEIVPLVADYRGEAAFDDALFGRRAEDHAGAVTGGAGNLAPDIVELLVGHPVLCIEQDVTVARGSRLAGQKLGEACMMDVDAVDIGAD